MKCFRLEASLVIYYQFDGKLGSCVVRSRHFRGKSKNKTIRRKRDLKLKTKQYETRS